LPSQSSSLKKLRIALFAAFPKGAVPRINVQFLEIDEGAVDVENESAQLLRSRHQSAKNSRKEEG